jgi:hypothetical protein
MGFISVDAEEGNAFQGTIDKSQINITTADRIQWVFSSQVKIEETWAGGVAQWRALA